MAQQSPNITNIVHRIATRLEREVNDRLPRRVRVIAVKHFNQKLPRQWILQQWTKALARDQTTARGKGADRRRKQLISAAPHLQYTTNINNEGPLS